MIVEIGNDIMTTKEQNHKAKCLIIMATYNGEKWIKEQIESVFKQENICTKLLISDDLSSDLTLKIINDLKKSNFDIDIFQRTSVSGTAGQNFMIFLELSKLRTMNMLHFVIKMMYGYLLSYLEQ